MLPDPNLALDRHLNVELAKPFHAGKNPPLPDPGSFQLVPIVPAQFIVDDRARSLELQGERETANGVQVWRYDEFGKSE